MRLDAQRLAVASYLNGGAWTLTAEFTEVESGRGSDRPLHFALLHREIDGADPTPCRPKAILALQLEPQTYTANESKKFDS